jgi:phosphomannomutase
LTTGLQSRTSTHFDIQVYWENAVQIIGPHDTGIAAAILDNLTPITWDIRSITTSDLLLNRTEDMKQAYFASLSNFSLHKELNGSSPIKFVNTSMHGVSHPFVTKAFEVYGFKSFVPVKEQMGPDPDCTFAWTLMVFEPISHRTFSPDGVVS